MKIPSEAELIEMERRIRIAMENCDSLASSHRRLDQDDVLDILDSLEVMHADFEVLIECVRAGAWVVPDAR